MYADYVVMLKIINMALFSAKNSEDPSSTSMKSLDEMRDPV